MDKSLIEAMKGKSREERKDFFVSHKAELLSPADLKSVNGGATTNPNSEVPFNGNWWSSWGFVCEGAHFCG